MRRRQTSRGNKSRNYILPAPLGGLNARDSLDAMAETDAVVMDNYIPGETKVSLRRGFSRYAAIGARVQTLAEFRAEDGNNRFFAFAGGSVWDVTSKQRPVDLEKDFSSDEWQTVQFKNRLFAVNGTDKPQVFYFNEKGEEVWEDASFSGENLVSELLVNAASSKQRLWFVEKGALKVWYSENVGEVQGNLLSFDLTTIARDGGCLTAIASWTQDGGEGMDDLTVFLTSEGEALVYAGNNPNSADDWKLKGIFRIARPIGYRCVLSYQGDIVVITEDGYLPLSKALPMACANNSQIAFSDKIRGLVLSRTRTNANKPGWQALVYNRGGYAIFNVPVNQQFEQHVINTNTGAWCRFTGIPALCWGMFNGRAYFGTDDGIMLFDDGYSDNHAYINGQVAQAYSGFGTSNIKKVQLLNPRTKSANPYALVVYTNADFSDMKIDFAENIGYAGLSKWSTAAYPSKIKWSSFAHPSGTKWATLQGTIRSQWIGNSATGFKFSLVFKTRTRGNLIEWYNTGVRFEEGLGII